MKQYSADVHAHFYTKDHLSAHKGALPYALPNPCLLQSHLDQLIALGLLPYLICNVHLSILPDSSHVFDSLDTLERLKRENPNKYGGIHMLGFINAAPEYATEAHLDYKGIKGVRLVLHDTKPESIVENEYKSEQWQNLYQRLIERDQHFLIYATNPATVLKILSCLPDKLKIDIDHLGNCESHVDDPNYTSLLREAKRRNNVYFKGPGYRTSINPHDVLPYMLKIIEIVGYDKLLLGATDAPHVGADATGSDYRISFPNLATIIGYQSRLLQRICNATQIDPFYFELINSCYAYHIPLPRGLIAYPFDGHACVMWQEATQFEIDGQSMRANFYTPSGGSNNNNAIFINCSGFTGLEHIHPQRFARALTSRGHTCFSFDYRGFGQNEQLSELGRVRLDGQIREIEASVEFLQRRFPTRRVILNGWGMAGGLVLKAATNLARRGINVSAVISKNGLFDSEAVQREVRGADGYADYCKWFDEQQSRRRTSGKDQVDIDPFDAYPLAPTTRQYVDEVLRKQPGYNDITRVDFEFTKQLREFKITAKDFHVLVKNRIPIHFIHGNQNDIHPFSQAEEAHAMTKGNSKLTILPGCNHTDFMDDGDPRFISMMRAVNTWVHDDVMQKRIGMNPANSTPDFGQEIKVRAKL